MNKNCEPFFAKSLKLFELNFRYVLKVLSVLRNISYDMRYKYCCNNRLDVYIAPVIYLPLVILTFTEK